MAKTVLAILLAACAATAGTGHAQISFRAAASAGVASGAFGTITHGNQGAADTDSGNCPQTISPALPAGTAAGNLLIAVVTSRDDDPITMTGWNTLYANVDSTTYQAAVFWRVATGTDPNTIDKTGAGCDVMIGRISRFTGVDPAAPFDGAVGASSQTAGTVTTGSMTTTFATSMLVITAHTADDSDTGSPAGFTEAWDSPTTTGNDASISLKYRLEAAAGAKGTFNMTKTQGSDPNHGVLFALRPARPSLTINVPTGTVTGDVMVAAIAVVGSGVVITPPAGWIAQPATLQGSATTSRQQAFYRVATGAEPASYTWQFESVHAGAAGGIVSYSGVDTTTPVDAFSGNTTPQGGDTNLQHRALGVATTVPDTMVVSTHSMASAQTWTPQGGIVERVDVASQGTPNANGISLSMNEVAQVAAGATGDKQSNVGANGDVGVAHILVLRPNAQNPVLQWTMDELLWNGTAGEVLDASGNGLHGRAISGPSTTNLTPAILGNPGTCRYGAFDGTNDYVEVADNALLDITDELTVMAWIRPTAWPTAGNLKSFLSKDNNYEVHLNSAGRINWWWGGAPLELTSTGVAALNTWTHVTLVYSRSGGFQRIYLNGVQDPTTNNQNGALATNNLPFQVAADQGFAGRNFAGAIDEVRVFRQALGPGRIQQYMNATRLCASVIDHFSISHAGSGVACDTHDITITAHDASHVAVDANVTLLTLSTSNARGTWTGIVAGGGTLTDTTAGDGAATYQFVPGSNSVLLSFRYANLVAATETFHFNVSGGGLSEATGTATASEDPLFTMVQAGFQFRNVTDGNTAIPTQISGKPSNTGFNAKTVRVQAIRTDTLTGSCTGLFASQTRSVDLGAECNSPSSCAGQQASVNGSSITTSANNGGTGAAGYTGVSLTFNAASEADTVITYPDAGQISLHARYDLDTAVAGFEALGSSNLFVVRPFGFAFPGIGHSNTAAGSLIGAAGDNFPMTVTAYQWASGEDAGNDGVPDAGANISDNGTVPNFAATVSVAPSSNLPGVALGSVARGATCASAANIALSGGTATGADWCYSEAGNVILSATSNDYLGVADADIAGTSGLDGGGAGGYVGRFRPKNFAISGIPTLTNRSAAACAPASAFTYMNEGLALAFTLVARNSQGTTTQNYNGVYAKLGIGTFANFNFGARSGTTNLIARVDSGANPVGSWSNGAAGVTATTGILRATPDNPDGPYTAVQFGIAPVDSDGVAMNTLDFDADGNTVNERTNFGVATEVRFGRLRLNNVLGSSLLDLPLPLSTQYYNGNFFVTNTLDSCTTISASDIAFSFLAATPNLVACETHLNPAGVIAFASGIAAVRLTKPGNANNGAVDLTVNLGAAPSGNTCTSAISSAATAANKTWLQGNWGSGIYNDDPSGRATFGIFKNADQFLYFREVY